jgi:hypothetical protein
MTLTELLQEVYNITNRPDLYSRTVSAVQSATLALHQREYWPRDLRESGIQFTTAEYLQSWEYAVNFPHFRALKYIRRSDAVGSPNGPFLEVITPDQVVDSYGINKENVCYLAGDVIQIRSCPQIQYAFVGVYVNPDITISGFSSWIANQNPYAIIHNAAAKILPAIGKREEVPAQVAFAQEHYQALLTSSLLAKGE